VDGTPAENVTLLLADWRNGDAQALERMLPIVYRELQRLAAAYLRRERDGHTLQPTALVHEAYVRLIGQDTPAFRNRSHFFGVAAHVMRQVLVDSARRHRAGKRGGGDHDRLPLDDLQIATPEQPHDVVALDDALTALAAVDPRKARVIEMRYFGGLSNAEIGDALEVSIPTVVRDARFAEAWLRQHLEAQG
jgi:RNA polymerase sigma-70 factor (ECF subfamily)